MKEKSPYEAGVWDCLPIPQEGPFFKVGDRVRSRGTKRVEGVVRSVQDDFYIVKTRAGLWGPAGKMEPGAFLLELIVVQHDGERDDQLSRAARAQDYDLIERAA